MGRMEYLAMKTDQTNSELIASDLKELGNAVKKLATHATMIGFGTTLLKWLASIAAMDSLSPWRWWNPAINKLRMHLGAIEKYLLILDRTNWRTNMLTSLLVPYIFLSLPPALFHFLRGDVGKWITFIHVVLRLFFPQHFPDWLEIPGSLILLLVCAPHLFAHTFRDSWVGVLICLAIGCYLLQEHIRASGGFRNSFTLSHGISNTLGIIVLLVYPIWHLVLYFL